MLQINIRNIFSTHDDEAEDPGFLCAAPAADQAAELNLKSGQRNFLSATLQWQSVK